MPDISLHCEAEGMYAYINIPDEGARKLTLQELYALLKQRHVIFGIDEQVLVGIVHGIFRGRRILVASGKPVEKGIDGRLEWFIDLSKAGKPRELENGSVNLRDLQIDLNVRKGDKLVRRLAAVPGKPGTTVFGTPVQPPPVKEIAITAGKGAAPDPNDQECIVAMMEGAVSFDGKIIEVRNQKVINGDVDYATGNVSFNGDLQITGSVRSGFSVSAKGDVVISGNVEEAEIKSAGSVIIQGGAVGSGNGMITCSGLLKVHHIAHFSVSAEKSVTILEDALHSTVMSEGEVTAKVIVGGLISAFCITAEIAGSTAETRTVIDIARMDQIARERYNLLKQFGILSTERTMHYEKLYCLVRDGMDEKGFLSGAALATLDSLKNTALQFIDAAAKIQDRLEKIDEIEKDRQGDATIRIGTVYPNTILKIGSKERLVKEQQRNICITSPRY